MTRETMRAKRDGFKNQNRKKEGHQQNVQWPDSNIVINK